MPFDWRIYTYRRWLASAKHRGIVVRMSFDDWWSIWAPHWDRRERDRLVMARNGDVGPYAPGNVRIITSADNVREQFANKFRTRFPQGRRLTD